MRHPDEEYSDEVGTVENSDDEEPKFSYQNTTIGPLETNQGCYCLPLCQERVQLPV